VYFTFRTEKQLTSPSIHFSTFQTDHGARKWSGAAEISMMMIMMRKHTRPVVIHNTGAPSGSAANPNARAAPGWRA
jgi:hypothetical protein